MSNKPIKLKEFKRSNGEKYYPVAGFSKAVYLAGRGLVYGAIGVYLLSLLTKVFQYIVDLLVSLLAYLNGINGADELGLKEMLKEILNAFFPNYVKYSDGVRIFFEKLHLVDISISIFEAGLVFLTVYCITLMFRHHYGEQRPFFDDVESRKLRKKALEGMDVKYDPNKIIGDDENNKRRKRNKTQLESDVLSTLKNIRVTVHTRRDLEVNEDVREYIVKIPQPKGKRVRETVLRQIQDLGSILTRATNGKAKFGEKEDEVSGEYFIFRASVNIEKELKREKFSKKKKKSGEVEKTILESNSEFSFPIELFKDNSSKIASQTAKAKKYAESQKQSLELYLSSAEIPASLTNMHIGNTSVEYLFSLSRTRKIPLNSMKEEIETFLHLSGVLVRLNAGQIQITLPLEENERIPIDVPSMINTVY
ncbi:hypothetical protein NNC41_08015 [Enterococcus faecium]|nr:hypothetical protein [Enterococcus faecium]HAQ1518033.1 hypothetical protein [Enterococcus faecium]